MLNKKIKLYSEREISFLTGGKVSIAHTNDDILSFVLESIKSGSSNKKIFFGMISDEVAHEIYNKIGINVQNYNLSLKADNVKKIFKDHGNIEREFLRGQEAITKDDFKYVLVEYVSDNNKTLEVQTMWKHKKKNSSNVFNVPKVP